MVGAVDGRPVFLRDVATIVDGPEEPATYVRFGAGFSAQGSARNARSESLPAVTLSVAKHKGENAVSVVSEVMRKAEFLRGTLLPGDVELTVTRNYGASASEKSNELLLHMGIAVVSVGILIWLALGKRESGIVMLAIPATLALTLTVFYLYGYTLNRITLFALIFSIGILVDDAIVVVENIARHTRLPENRGRDLAEVAVRAVDEVGNPTILATMTVIAAILPMAFVGGLMGPYMRPIPVGASAAMISRSSSRSSSRHGRLSDSSSTCRLPTMSREHAHAVLSERHGSAPAHRKTRTAFPQRGRCPAGWRHGARGDPVGSREDASVRQQGRIPGHRRHARRHSARADRSRDTSSRRRHPHRARSDDLPDLRRYFGALQLQRSRSPRFLAAGVQRRRHPGQSRREG